MNTDNARKTRELVEVALFAAIVCILAFTPFIGYIPIGPIKATTIHIPVIIAGIMLGTKRGAIIGFVFGLTSFLGATFNPNLSSFLFSPFYPGGNVFSLVICFIPRILIGVNASLTYKGLMKAIPESNKAKQTIAMSLSGIVGSLTNTILVMGLTYFLFGQQYAEVRQVGMEALLGIILSVVCINGIPEAIVAAIITTAVCTALKKMKRHK